MELRHLRYFTAVTDAATLVGAARELGVAQPALSRQIHALERELDVELFDRGPRGVVLTPAGEVVDASARHVLRQVDIAVLRARGAGLGSTGRCVLCCGARSLASGLIARILVRLRQRYPEVELRVIEGMFDRQFQMLQVGEADIGIGIPVYAAFPDLSSETVDFDVFDCALLAATHPLAHRGSLALHELAGETLVTWGSSIGPELQRQIETSFREKKFKPAARRVHEHFFAIAAAVAAGQGWSLMYRAAGPLVPPGTVIVPLTDFALPVGHAIVWRTNEHRPVVRRVIEVMRDVMAEERTNRREVSEKAVDIKPAPVVAMEQSRVSPSSVLELRHLRYFCAVVDAGSFGRAAADLELTQPALSRQVGDLERVVGCPLLDRVTRGTTATPAGESFHRSARRILDEVGAIAAETQRARRGAIARCVIGAVPTPSARALFATLIRDMSASMPHLELAIEDLATPAQPVALRDARIDLGICHASPMSLVEQRGIERVRLTTDVVNCAIVHRDNPLAAREHITLHDLAELPFLFPDRDFQPGMYDQLFGMFERLSFRPRVEATYDGLQTIWALVGQGMGWGIGFASQCAAPPPGTVSVLIDDFSLPWGLDLIARDDESRSLVLGVADRLREIAHSSPR